MNLFGSTRVCWHGSTGVSHQSDHGALYTMPLLILTQILGGAASREYRKAKQDVCLLRAHFDDDAQLTRQNNCIWIGDVEIL